MASIRTLQLLGVLLLVQTVAATQFTVGGSSGWAVPSDSNAVYNQWAQRMRFQIGDSLLFVYPSNRDSVLRVTKDDYANCSTASPIEKYTDGHTVFTFSDSGPYYFISGNKDNCQKNEKLLVVVLADRSKKAAPAPAPSTPTTPDPPPAPSAATPAPAPTTTTPDQMPPSPPPEAPSTPAPTHNDASSIARSVFGSVGALAGLAALLVAL